MDCPDCALKLNKTLQSIPGLETAQVNFLDQSLAVSGGDQLPRDRIVAAIKSHGFEAHELSANHHLHDSSALTSRVFARKDLLAFAFSIVLVISNLLFEHFVSGLEIVRLTLVLTAIMLCGISVLQKGWRSAISLRLDINFLMSVAVVGALIIGEWTEAAVIILLFALSEKLEELSLNRSRRAVESLVRLAPRQAVLFEHGLPIVAPVETIRVGQIILIKPGAMIPLDGEVVAGSSSVNQANLTGESIPVLKTEGSQVLSGTLNQEGSLQVRVTHQTGDTTFDRIIELVKQAQMQKAQSQQFIEKFAQVYTPVVTGAALLIAVLPPLLMGALWSEWIYRALALLVISCPCALVISTPVTVISAITAAARKGVLIKGGRYLEALSEVTALAFDKTGTLTQGKLTVSQVVCFNGLPPDEILALVASIENHSEHPIAQAITDQARQQNLTLQDVVHFTALPGQGVSAQVQNRELVVGNRQFIAQYLHQPLDPEIQFKQAGGTQVFVAESGQLLGLISLSDAIREESAEVLTTLKQQGIKNIHLLTGDNHEAGMKLRESLALDEVQTDLLPHQKVEQVQQIVSRFGRVAMIGDGVNDAPALAAANVGIAMGGSGSETALETADVVLMSDRLSRLPWLFRLARRSRRIIAFNIVFAVVVKLIFILLATTGHATLWMAVFADTGVSLLVIFNGLRALNTK